MWVDLYVVFHVEHRATGLSGFDEPPECSTWNDLSSLLLFGSPSMERRLGRGLGSLLSKPAPTERQHEIELSRVVANPFQPRTTFDEEGLDELRASIEMHGVLQPVIVRMGPPGGDGDVFELISGERRCRASRLAGKTHIPAVVRTGVRDDAMLELALVENLQRRDLDPIERARGFGQLLSTLSLTQEEVARRVGLKRSTVANHLRLLELSSPIQESVGRGLLSMGHARAILGAEKADREALMEDVVREGLSVRQVERRVRNLLQPRTGRGSSAPKGVLQPQARSQPTEPAWVAELENRLRESLGTKVRIQNGPEYRGQIVLEYYDQASLDSLITRLAPRRTL